ncbi:hypothetical protein [Kribbella shirazensis]|uniref:Uncharacterized protein n=1 Tax=Kribbella shirazensis TaxID=1105143 RepID=A0A7X5VGY4_9ACTN|nr:hypothetical protein [Kribbella shirazensis]NIK61018.1 hypothetical protein [Kribbella shirazensis]
MFGPGLFGPGLFGDPSASHLITLLQVFNSGPHAATGYGAISPHIARGYGTISPRAARGYGASTAGARGYGASAALARAYGASTAVTRGYGAIRPDFVQVASVGGWSGVRGVKVLVGRVGVRGGPGGEASEGSGSGVRVGGWGSTEDLHAQRRYESEPLPNPRSEACGEPVG